jgi:hypothetical protein
MSVGVWLLGTCCLRLSSWTDTCCLRLPSRTETIRLCRWVASVSPLLVFQGIIAGLDRRYFAVSLFCVVNANMYLSEEVLRAADTVHHIPLAQEEGQRVRRVPAGITYATLNSAMIYVNVNVIVNELRLGFSSTTRNPEGILSLNSILA